jgi:hypothetical protein
MRGNYARGIGQNKTMTSSTNLILPAQCIYREYVGSRGAVLVKLPRHSGLYSTYEVELLIAF